MTIEVDLMLLETWQRFQAFCFQIARAEYSKTGVVVQLGLSWDGGRDVVVLLRAKNGATSSETIVLQSKFTRSCGSDTKRSIIKSLDAVAGLAAKPAAFILCMPMDPTGRFLDWFREEMTRREMPYDIWGRSELLVRLERRTDIFQSFFYRVFAEIEAAFVNDDLELRRFKLDPACSWTAPDSSVLAFRSNGTESPDLLFDVIVRNRGRLEACMTQIVAHVGDRTPNPHGFPPQGLLFPKITYAVALGRGRPGHYTQDCEPPLVIRPGRHERFKIRLRDTGYAWIGIVQIELVYGERRLPLPCVRLST